MGQVSLGVPLRDHALVHLDHMHAFPRDFFASQGAQHFPRGLAAADGQNETAARGHSQPSLPGDNRGGLLGNRISIVKHFNHHGSDS